MTRRLSTCAKIREAAPQAAMVIDGRLLSLVRGYGTAAADVEGLGGVRLAAVFPHQDFVDKSKFRTSTLEVSVPTEAAAQFAAAELTSQQMIDAAIVVVDSNRVHVKLGE